MMWQAFVQKHRRAESVDTTLSRAAQLAKDFAASASSLSE
jgi:hypothetical protein